MKIHFLLILAFSFMIQLGAFADNAPKHALNVQVQQQPAQNPQKVNDQATPHHKNDPFSSYDDEDEDEDEDEEEDDNDDDDEDYSSEHKGSSYSSASGSGRASAPPSQNMPQTTKNSGVEQTLSIIKPDGVKNNHIGDIISRFEKNGLKVVALRMTNLSKDQAVKFYQVHRDRPFFNDLVNFMSSGPVVVVVLEGNNAIDKNRQLMGATNPEKAERGTLRADFAKSVTENIVHGSDSQAAAKEEILFFFKPEEISRQ